MDGERVTLDYIKLRIDKVSYLRPDAAGTLTLCVLVLDNGFQLVGKSACVDPTLFSREIGEKIAYDDAIDQCWALFGFLLAESRFLLAVKQD